VIGWSPSPSRPNPPRALPVPGCSEAAARCPCCQEVYTSVQGNTHTRVTKYIDSELQVVQEGSKRQPEIGTARPPKKMDEERGLSSFAHQGCTGPHPGEPQQPPAPRLCLRPALQPEAPQKSVRGSSRAAIAHSELEPLIMSVRPPIMRSAIAPVSPVRLRGGASGVGGGHGEWGLWRSGCR